MSSQARQLPRNTFHGITSRGRQSSSLPTAFWELLHPRLCHLRKIQAVSRKVRVSLAFEMMSSGACCCRVLFPGKATHYLIHHVLGSMGSQRPPVSHSNLEQRSRTAKHGAVLLWQNSCVLEEGCGRVPRRSVCLFLPSSPLTSLTFPTTKARPSTLCRSHGLSNSAPRP